MTDHYDELAEQYHNCLDENEKLKKQLKNANDELDKIYGLLGE